MNDAETKIEVVVDDESIADVMAELTRVGAGDIQEVKQYGLTGIEIVVAAVLVASSVPNLVTKFLRVWKCGVVVDARLPKVLIQKNCDLPPGSVLIINSDGTQVKLDNVADTQLKDLLATLGRKNS